MIRTRVRLRDCGWNVVVWLSVDRFDAGLVLEDLLDIGISGSNLESARRNLWSRSLNNGITFTDVAGRRAVMVIGRTTSPAQFSNTLTHEIGHLALFISRAMGVDPYSEDVCYLAGGIAERLHPYTSLFMCGCGRKRLRRMTV